jgi:hypothetical protein
MPEGRQYPLLCFKNAWYPWFFTHHDLTGKDDVPAVEVKKRIGGVYDKLTIFLEDSEDSGCPGEADEIKRYCEGGKLADVVDGVGEAGMRRVAWVDDRNSLSLTGSGNTRSCKNPMTATGVLRHLRQPVRRERPLILPDQLLTLH